ncbi:hypothetical protein RvY_11601 [Ramazzottius varieornatus]|uniref:Uncharacterized protein n=1 Tax=Ramazzottius varieornatus TaxID=947166 RepID=A0A1D1VPF1_RAMVA|nr:hypothetical protein RvY_11601 [Ramazzottius varieornatus]
MQKSSFALGSIFGQLPRVAQTRPTENVKHGQPLWVLRPWPIDTLSQDYGRGSMVKHYAE